MTSKVSFLPSVADKIQKIIEENNIVTPITLIESERGAIGYSLHMEFEIDLNGREAVARIALVDESDW